MTLAHRTTQAFVDPRPVTDLGRLFDLPDEPRPGDPLPALWHWVALAGWSPLRDVGLDGHPRVGDFLPDVGKPRRMFAGGTVTFHRDLAIGSEIEREDRVVSVRKKSGRSGDFVLVGVETTLRDRDGETAVTETQNLVYRDAAPVVPDDARPGAPAPAGLGGPVIERTGEAWRFRTDPVTLMRFSAATSNSHRIHYDWPYATGIEGYAGLVVHGPLMTLALAEALRSTGSAPRTLSHRAVRPLFCGQDATIRAVTSCQDVTLTLAGAAGTHSELIATPR